MVTVFFHKPIYIETILITITFTLIKIDNTRNIIYFPFL